VDALDPRPDDTFLEIGPGRGALTAPLAARVRKVVAIEIDRDLASTLVSRLPAVRVVLADFLDVDLPALLRDEPTPIRVVGNLPYNVASPILFKLLHDADDGRLLRDATLMLQKEVADRIAAQPGSRDYGALAIQVGLLADVDRILSLPPGAFRPPPRVKSAVLRLRFRPPTVDVGDRKTFEKLVRGLFLQRRKTLANALEPVAGAMGRSAAELIGQAHVDGSKRPAALSLDDVARLARAML
jgi:16S rRNA (adenine1518-N6/adenine1519-N6)-dimethyltransferase